jgi:putative peptide zinc metalloprotease protein
MALTLVLAPMAPAFAAQDNEAIAINNEDGSSLFRFAFDIHRTMDSVIEETNIAISYASCEGCQTVAVAIQIVLVSSSDPSLAPENVAVAINEECISCETMASAYQFVAGTGGKTKLDKEGRKLIKDVRKAFYDLAKEAKADNLTNAEIEARLLPLVEQVKDVLDNHLVAAEPPGRGADGPDGVGTAGEDGTPSPEASASAAPAPTAAESPEPEESPTPDGPVAASGASPSPSPSS